MSKHRLLPCPFCGGTNIFLGKTRRWWVSCDGCGCDGPHYGTAKGAADGWNDRQAFDLRDDASEYVAGDQEQRARCAQCGVSPPRNVHYCRGCDAPVCLTCGEAHQCDRAHALVTDLETIIEGKQDWMHIIRCVRGHIDGMPDETAERLRGLREELDKTRAAFAWSQNMSSSGEVASLVGMLHDAKAQAATAEARGYARGLERAARLFDGAGPEDEVGALDAAAMIRALASETEGK